LTGYLKSTIVSAEKYTCAKGSLDPVLSHGTKKLIRDRQCLILVMKKYPVEGKGDK
jgi:hypothetical protein